MSHKEFEEFKEFSATAKPFILDQEPDGFDFDEKGGQNHLTFWFDGEEIYSTDKDAYLEDVADYLRSVGQEFGVKRCSFFASLFDAAREHDDEKVIEFAKIAEKLDFWLHLQNHLGEQGFYTYQSDTRFIVFETAAFDRQGLADQIEDWREFKGSDAFLTLIEPPKALENVLIANDLDARKVILPATTFEKIRSVLAATLARECEDFDADYDFEELAKEPLHCIPDFLARGFGLSETNVFQWDAWQKECPEKFAEFHEKYIRKHAIADAFDAVLEIHQSLETDEPAYTLFEVDENDAVVSVILEGVGADIAEGEINSLSGNWEGYQDHRRLGVLSKSCVGELERVGFSQIYKKP